MGTPPTKMNVKPLNSWTGVAAIADEGSDMWGWVIVEDGIVTVVSGEPCAKNPTTAQGIAAGVLAMRESRTDGGA